MPHSHSLFGKHIIVTSGPTYEPIDPVRFLGNRSSGQQGHAVAAAFADIGARVTLITGPVRIPDPSGVSVVHVETATEMLNAVMAALPADAAVCAAAVSDWRAQNIAPNKMKKREGDDTLTITFIRNPDILDSLGHSPQRPAVLVGFAAETHNVIEYARLKLDAKNADLILANDVSNGAVFGTDNTQLIAITPTGHVDWGALNKLQSAQKIVSTVTQLLKEKTAP